MLRARVVLVVVSLVSVSFALNGRADGFGSGSAAGLQSVEAAPAAAGAFAQSATREQALEPGEPAPPWMAPQARVLRPQPNYQPNDISIEGNVSYATSGSTLNLKADRVANNRSGGVSGTLRLYLWATPSRPVFGSTLSGYVLGYYQFSTTLQAGFYFGNVDRTVTYTQPPNGTYFVTMALEEFAASGNYEYHDLVIFSSTITIGAVQPVISDHSMTDDVDPISYQPTRRTGSFNNTSNRATSWVKFTSFVGSHSLQWRWFAPDGSTYVNSDVFNESGAAGQTYYYWFYISIAGYPPATRPGTWRVTFYVDGNAAFSDTFNIVSSAVCTPSASTVCLNNNRFAVSVNFKTPDGKPGTGQAIKYTEDTALFWFFSASNIEMVLKVLNACGLNSRYWVYGAASTDVEYTITVTDTKTQTTKTYSHPPGSAAPAITDGNAFATCP
jgi:hypothetical protein